MAEVRTIVELSRKEMDDLLVEAAKTHLKVGIGSSDCQYMMEKLAGGGENVVGFRVIFNGKVRT